MSTAVVLENPKYPHNVGQAVRAASLFDATTVVTSGDRVPLKPHDGYRLPREERYWKYANVQLVNDDHPIHRAMQILQSETGHGASVVGVELHHGAVPLPLFQHAPDATRNTIYVFGPEDGSISKELRAHCHQFVFIPTPSCLNLAAAVNVVLYDRMLKEVMEGQRLVGSVEEMLMR